LGSLTTTCHSKIKPFTQNGKNKMANEQKQAINISLILNIIIKNAFQQFTLNKVIS
jgi:hypothetical protein